MSKYIRMVSVLFLLVTMSLNAFAINNYDISDVLSDTASYIYNTVSNPQIGSIGGEWAVLGLARSDIKIPSEYYRTYYDNAEKYISDCNGNLHSKKYTEYARVIIAITAIGGDPKNISGYNLLEPLGDYEKTIAQGINGPIWALIALDSGNYDIPENTKANLCATREMYIERILECQLPGGGWSLMYTNETSDPKTLPDPDITGMALQALAKYQDNKEVKSATELALNAMSGLQDEKGGFSSYGTQNSESCVQILVALCELGISVDDSRFVKNGNTILDSLMSHYIHNGCFTHEKNDSNSNLMATEQALYCLVALQRKEAGKQSLYRMSDVVSPLFSSDENIGLENKHEDIKVSKILYTGKSFEDIMNKNEKTAIEQLASRGIISGKSEKMFFPDNTMTRAEFATITTRALGLNYKTAQIFDDVKTSDWYYDYVNTAYYYGIIKGVSDKYFNPYSTITREEAAVIIARAARLCGINTNMVNSETRDILAQFIDYTTASEWAKDSLAFCFREKILNDSVLEIEPQEAVSRSEIANMIYNLLLNAKLI